MVHDREATVICGGGGKTRLFKDKPEKYLDIDFFMWNNLDIKKKIEKLLLNKNINSIGNLYKKIMESNNTLRNDKRIILIHRPENALWLDRKIIGIYRPTKRLHELNIRDRSPFLKNLARNDWNSLEKYNPIEFDSYPFI